MKSIFRLSAISISFVCWICACSNTEKIREGIFRGMYEGGHQIQEIKRSDELPQPGEEPPTYDQYTRERQAMITSGKEDGPPP